MQIDQIPPADKTLLTSTETDALGDIFDEAEICFEVRGVLRNILGSDWHPLTQTREAIAHITGLPIGSQVISRMFFVTGHIDRLGDEPPRTVRIF